MQTTPPLGRPAVPLRTAIAHLLFIALLSTLLLPRTARSQLLAPHPPLRILIVSDEVNPHNLSDAELTQPGELAVMLLELSDLNLDWSQPDPVQEIDTNDLDQATALLALGPDHAAGYDVLIYFAHRIPNDGPSAQADQDDQDAFVGATETFLEVGGGVVSFHHGLYETGGKAGMQSVLGAAATGSVVWNSTDGQNVISVADHFITDYGVSYSGSTSYSDPANGIAADSYPSFNNIPDERYPNQAFEPDAAGIEILLTSDYSSQHVLSYTHRRPSWEGVVWVYQPGEHQPTALEPGNNLQILLNGILYTAQFRSGELLFADGFESGATDQW